MLQLGLIFLLCLKGFIVFKDIVSVVETVLPLCDKTVHQYVDAAFTVIEDGLDLRQLTSSLSSDEE